MRILYVTAAFLPESIGGVELHLYGIARSLRGEHEVAVCCRGANPDRPELEIERYEYDGIPVHRINYLFSDCDGFPRVYRNPALRARIDEVLAEFEPDVVHVHHLTCLTTDLIDAARERGIRVVMTLHDFWMGCPRGQRMTRDLELCEDVVVERCVDCLTQMWSGWFGEGRHGPDLPRDEARRRDLEMLEEYHDWTRGLLGRVDQLVTPSRSSKEIFVRYGVDERRIEVVENGLDAAPFRAIERTESPTFRFGFIGSVLPTKGVHVLLDAFLALDRDDCRLDIYGEMLPWHEVTDYGERLLAQAEPAGNRVTFHGRYEQSELPEILGRIDALVIPSLWFEAFCLTLREGQLAGLPVLVSDLGAMREGVEDGVTGLLFRPGDASDLAAKMALVLENEELRRRLTRTEKRVRTVTENAAELLALYQGDEASVARGE